MPRSLALTLFLGLCLGLCLPSFASGSVGAGGSKAGGRGEYTVGKVLMHRTVVCDGCAIAKRAFTAERAGAMMNDIDAALSGSSPTEMVRSLCADGDRADCAAKLRATQTYLKRRFRL